MNVNMEFKQNNTAVDTYQFKIQNQYNFRKLQ